MYFAYKYNGMEEGLLASTNAGGENVARSAALGALYGAAGGMAGIPPHLISGLSNHDAIESDIERFVAALAAKAPDVNNDAKL
jgi:ADP-ribosylglycohydrolase